LVWAAVPVFWEEMVVVVVVAEEAGE